MAESVHPAAPHHLPSFITAPGDTDVLMVLSTILLAVGVMAFGVLFFRIHTLPERMAHTAKKIQFELVAILGLIALFTHMHIFWIAGLVLAVIDIPDFGTSLGRIATSAEKIADRQSGEAVADVPRPAAPPTDKMQGEAISWTKPEIAPANQKERSHA
jgi:hypothetical protein